MGCVLIILKNLEKGKWFFISLLLIKSLQCCLGRSSLFDTARMLVFLEQPSVQNTVKNWFVTAQSHFSSWIKLKKKPTTTHTKKTRKQTKTTKPKKPKSKHFNQRNYCLAKLAFMSVWWFVSDLVIRFRYYWPRGGHGSWAPGPVTVGPKRCWWRAELKWAARGGRSGTRHHGPAAWQRKINPCAPLLLEAEASL